MIQKHYCVLNNLFILHLGPHVPVIVAPLHACNIGCYRLDICDCLGLSAHARGVIIIIATSIKTIIRCLAGTFNCHNIMVSHCIK